MIVMKFGGTSLGDGEKVRAAATLVRERVAEAPLVVVSAHGRSPGPDGGEREKVTDLLIQTAKKALAGDPLSGFAEVQGRHYEILDHLGLARDLIGRELAELNELLHGIYLIKELTPRTLDFVMSFGERMSARTLARELRSQGVNAACVESYDLGFLTDSNYGRARPLPDAPRRIAEAVAARDEEVTVTTGFIGKNAAGEITTLGRQGSDYSASYFAAALGASEVQIWTDVDGVLTADPSIVPGAKPLERMAFREAAELAYYGAEVLHPATIVPAIEKGIPIRVLNTFKPALPGTTILPSVEGEAARVKSIVYKENLTLINVVSSRMLGQAGFMARLFDVFRRHDVVIDMIATSEISVSLTTDRPLSRPFAASGRSQPPPAGVGWAEPKAEQGLEKGVEAAARELSEVADVTVEPGKAIICVVGGGMRHVLGMAARVFGAIAGADVNIQMISQGASEINIALLVDNEDIRPAVVALHREFFE